jgi:glycerate kinase
MRFLLAFDKFKGCMSASEACAVAAKALEKAVPGAEVVLCPVSDGGEGFCEVLAGGGRGRLAEIAVTGPIGERRQASVGFVDADGLDAALLDVLELPRTGEIAVVEMAAASGLGCVPEARRNPWKATSRGTGEMLAFAAGEGASGIVLGIGGSATCDLGLGALEALGLSAVCSGKSVERFTPECFDSLEGFVGEPMKLPPVRVACDVTNPLCGPNGTAAVYGPQKGLRQADVARMDAGIRRAASLLVAHFHVDPGILATPGFGAAGGIGCGLAIACGARMTPGADLVWRWRGMDKLLRGADVVITGEGAYDATSASGKGPGEIVRRAAALGKKTLVLAGRVDLKDVEKSGFGTATFRAITPPGMPQNEALARGGEFLAATIAELFA